jgi:hypothetical protein
MVLLRVQLHKVLRNGKGRVGLLKRSGAVSKLYAYVSMYVHAHTFHTHQEIRSFKLTLLAASVASELDSDKTNLYVRKITDTLCKLKNNQSIFSLKCLFV